jgi:hypothetical protein|eukprot:272447-Prymnesium_polylepis.3
MSDSELDEEVLPRGVLGGAAAETTDGSETNSDADARSEDEGDGPLMDTKEEGDEQRSAAAAFDAAISSLSNDKTEKVRQLRALWTLCFKALSENSNRRMNGSKRWQALKEAVSSPSRSDGQSRNRSCAW